MTLCSDRTTALLRRTNTSQSEMGLEMDCRGLFCFERGYIMRAKDGVEVEVWWKEGNTTRENF